MPAKFHFQRGFTLLEICLVLLLMAVLTGLVLPHAASSFQRHQLQETSRQLQTLAQTAQQKAVLEYNHHYILFKKGVIELHENEKEMIDQIQLDESIQYQIMQYTDSTWRAPENIKWWFSPSGIAAPIRISFKDQNSWLGTAFDPLTLATVDEHYQLN